MRLYWQGASTVLTRRLLHQPEAVWRELPRRLLVAALLAPMVLIPRGSTRLLGARWRLGLRRRLRPGGLRLARHQDRHKVRDHASKRVILYRWQGAASISAMS